MNDLQVPPPTPAQLGRLAEALSVGELRVDRRLTGGLSCTMDVLTDGDRRLVLRRYGPWVGPEARPAAREAAALRLAATGGVPVPAPVWVDDSGVFARHAIVLSHVEGSPDVAPTDPGAWARQLAETLADVHAIDPVDEPFPRLEPRDVQPDEPISERFARHDLGPAVRAALLAELDTLPPLPTAFLHGDFWPGNTMWRDGRLVAVVDWEQPSVGDPMADVAYCMTDMGYIGLDVAPTFLDAYLERTGRSTESLRFWGLVAVSRPLPDIAQWVPAWQQMGLDVTVEEVRARHRVAIEAALG